ncbi:structural maintenance of chromosomes protein 5 [Tetranychus urticae]|uniref:structural maintenance of chromosomes protein 5 n=1 Tax=Tetranychus urticae TaxID=32264 RepID=UPI00077B9560|nr:structural maintenance of chromosomes protein 5 [Tetranychus urticae]
MSNRRKRRSNQVDQELNDDAPDENVDGPFSRGSIIRIRLKNFMTYKSVELHAGPYLNMVLGPNGTGKSALVCAIIVGLGGDPSATGRSGQLNEYIRFGCPYAQTEIELFNPSGDNYVIKRKISTSGDGKSKSDWLLNKVPKKLSEIKELISSLNIRVSNLCQFLPQEKVVEFARMNPVQLLENTQKAAGDENMFTTHEKLIKYSDKIKELRKKKANLDQQLATDQHLTDRLIEAVERVREKEQYAEKLSWLQKKKPWLEFEQVRQEYVEAKANLERRVKEYEKSRSQNKPLEEKVDKEISAINKAIAEPKASLEELKPPLHLVPTHKKGGNKLSHKNNELESEKSLLQERLDASADENYASRIEEIEHEITEKHTSLKQLTISKDKMVQEIEKMKERYRQLRSERDQIINVEVRRRELLKRTDPKVWDAAEWLRRNREKFSRMIYEPMMTQINVKCAEWICYVEATIPRRDLVAFVCEDIEDLKKFTTMLKRDNLNVNVVQAPGADDVNMDPKLPMDDLSPYGFKHYIKDLFDAPDAITRYLCKNYNLHNVPVGDEDVDSNRFLRENSQIQRFFCGNTSHSWTVSRYDREKVISTDRLRDPSLLVMIVDNVRKRQIEERMEAIQSKGKALESEKASMEEKIEHLRSQMYSLRDTRKQLIEKRDEKKNSAKRRLQKAKDELDKSNKKFENYETDIERLKEIRDEARREAKKKQKDAQLAINCNEAELPKDVKNRFKKLPDTLPEVEEEMRRLALRMSSMEELCDESVLNDYNQQTDLIKRRKREIDLVSADLRLIESDVAAFKGRWIPAIQELIGRIDKNFSKFMSRLEYAGDVSLSHGDDPEDFSTYGISIKVRYRDNETLKELSAFHQSGGERSVATMIYMIALQELTKVPFRIVDEINQGMDDTNERRVFDLIVETASTNSSQYFLFSPKLLPKLTYTDRMHIHVIFNGPKFSVDWNRCKAQIAA